MKILETLRSSEMISTRYTVGALAKATDTKAVTIRYYEQVGLLLPAGRSVSGYRFYTDEERDRLLFIRRSRALGFSLDDIRELLSFANNRRFLRQGGRKSRRAVRPSPNAHPRPARFGG